MAIQPTPPNRTHPKIRVIIAGLMKGDLWLISPDHKGPRLFLGRATESDPRLRACQHGNAWRQSTQVYHSQHCLWLLAYLANG